MLTAKLILERFDKDHLLLERREQPSRSFTLGFIQMLYLAHAQIDTATPYPMNDITNTARDVDGDGTTAMRTTKANLKIGASPGNSGMYCSCGELSSINSTLNADTMTIEGEKVGIVVGTGVGAVTPTDYALGTRIVHGSGANEFEYGGCELLSIAFANPNGEFTIRRYFTNNSGGAITVAEVGIYAVGCLAKGPTGMVWESYSFLIARDLTGGVAVANTELLRVTYVPQITV